MGDPHFEVVAIMANGSTQRSDHKEVARAYDAWRALPDAIFKCILGYLDDADMTPRVVARSY